MDSGPREAWTIRDVDDAARLRLVKDLGLHDVTARCLVARGVTEPDKAGNFLAPRLGQLRPPAGMAGFREAQERLVSAIQRRETIGIFGDYDVDGVTSTALLTSFLRGIGATVVRKVAERDAGYGFGEAQALWFADQGCRLIVTLDCGTSDVPAILAARARGVDVIVVDHHQVPDRADHPALALLNPHRPDSTYPFRGLCSAGLAFYVAAGLRTALRQAGWFTGGRAEPDIRNLLDLVAVGTIADLAPLREENRILVTAGLAELSQRRRPGLLALLRAAQVPDDRPLDEIDVGWRIGPRLNAPGRLGDAEPALALLLAADTAEAEQRVAVLEEANTRRRLIQDQMLAEALVDAAALPDLPALVVARAGWHAGVAGIVAAKLVDRFARPSVVIAIDERKGEGRGSVRSVPGVDAYRALHACREHLVRYGGHAQAAGLSVDLSQGAARIEALRHAFANEAATCERTPPSIAVDALLSLGDVSDKLATELGSLAPFGMANQAPVLAAQGSRVTASRRVGEDGSHLKLTLECGRDLSSHQAIAFRMGERDPGVGATVDVAFRPEVSTFRGTRRLELNVCALRPAL
jgi:single-stranded-DNA-specific exonuclease